MRVPRVTGVAVASVLLAACSGSPMPTPSSSAPGPAGGATPTVLPFTHLANGAGLPPGCDGGVPPATATVTFVAAGAAWAMDPDGANVTCLFETADPGPFAWGPLADRVLLGGLTVRGTGAAPSRSGSGLEPLAASWGRPTGVSVVFVPPDRRSLMKAHLDAPGVDDISPFPDARYLSVAYHPSGLALAFAVERNGSDSIWISTNTGTKPRRLVFTEVATRFGPIAFREDGIALVYAAQNVDDVSVLHLIAVSDTNDSPVIWRGEKGQRVLGISPGPLAGDVALTAGTGCANRVALAPEPLEYGRKLVPDESRPTRVVGWLDHATVMVAAGGCGEAADLFAVNTADLTATPLVTGVVAAAVRVPAPVPTPELPRAVAAERGAGFG